MTRSSSVNFTGANSFSKGDAATDPFLRQDIQQLAAAVDVHDHTTGKGKIVAAGMPLDVVPSSPSAYDDDFTGSSLDAKWTSPLTAAVGVSATILGANWLRMRSSLGSGSVGRGAVGIRQNAPAGSFQIMARVSEAASGTDARAGLFVARTANTLAHVWGMNQTQTLVANAIGCATYSETVAWGAFDGFNSSVAGSTTNPVWLRIRYDLSATTLYFDYSSTGIEWINAFTRTSQSQPDRMGLAIYANTAFNFGETLYVDWFRFLPNATF